MIGMVLVYTESGIYTFNTTNSLMTFDSTATLNLGYQTIITLLRPMM